MTDGQHVCVRFGDESVPDCSIAVVTVSDRAIGHGGMLWDGCLCLSHYLWKVVADEGWKYESNVFELGAGCALPSLTLHQVATKVNSLCKPLRIVVTDKPAMLDLVHLILSSSDEYAAPGALTARPFCFGGSISKLVASLKKDILASSKVPDVASHSADSDIALDASASDDDAIHVVLASDILGFPSLYDSIMKTFSDIFRSYPTAVILLAYRERSPEEAVFFEYMLDQAWECRQIAEYDSDSIKTIHAGVFQWMEDAWIASDSCCEQDATGEPVYIFEVRANKT